MKRFLICTLAAAVIAVSLACCGVSEAEAGQQNMFETIQLNYSDEYYVVCHKETKVMYVVSRGYRNEGNFTVLVNPDGTPMIWRE